MKKIDNAKLPSPFVVAVLEDYFNERPINCFVDISKLPPEHGYRRAVIDALNTSHKSVQVSYETFGTYDDFAAVKSKKGITILGDVVLSEDSSIEYDGYTIPEDWEEGDLEAWQAEQANPTLSHRDKEWAAQVYHSTGAVEAVMARFNLTREQVEAISKEITPEHLERQRQAVIADQDALMGGFKGIFE